jgi:hypothetical protein
MKLITIELNKNGSIKASSRKAFPDIDSDIIFYLELFANGQIEYYQIDPKKIIKSDVKIIFPELYPKLIIGMKKALYTVEHTYLEKYKDNIWSSDKIVKMTYTPQ